ncbi:MAG: DUF4382 domain-containing protein [Candidatus Acidiferrales bacterium]
MERKPLTSFYGGLAVLLTAVLAAVILVSCGSSEPPPTPTSNVTSTVTTSISDPPICEPPAGQFAHAWVTITKVRAHISETAEGGASGWVDLVDLTTNPRQIDLLGGDSTQCILALLGSTTALPAGKYGQIRLHLLANGPPGTAAAPSPNNCAPELTNIFNCVQLMDDSGPKQQLLLSSQAQTGIKIPPGQIAGGGLMLEANQTADINISFNACLSIVEQGNGEFRLKPTLRAGEVSTADTVAGTVVEVVDAMANTTQPLPAGAVVQVFIEDTSDPQNPKIIETIMAGTSGSFSLCPVPQPVPTGGFTVVATAIVPDPAAVGVTATYNATVLFGVQPGAAVGNIGLIKEADPSEPAQIDGVLTSTPNTLAVPFSLFALQEVTGPSGATKVIIPVFTLVDEGIESTPAVQTDPAAMVACPMGAPMGSLCANYTLFTPASNPRVGNTGSPAGPPVNFFVNAQVPTEITCDAASKTTAAFAVMPAMTAAAPRLDFGPCMTTAP